MLRGDRSSISPGQLERGESGNVHLQYLVQFTTAKRLNGVRAAVSDQTLEPIYGSIAQARAYVTKEATRIDGPWEYGQIAASGHPGLNKAVDALLYGDTPQRCPRSSRYLGSPTPRPSRPQAARRTPTAARS